MSDSSTPADLVKELRRVDGAFAQLRAGHDDELEALFDTDPVVRGARRPRLGVGVAALACAVVVGISVVAGSGAFDPAVGAGIAQVGHHSEHPKGAATPAPPKVLQTPTTHAPALMAMGPAPLKLLGLHVDDLRSALAGAPDRPLTPAHNVDNLSLMVPVNDAVIPRPRAETSVASSMGVGAALDVVGDDEVQAALEQVRALRSRSAYQDAAAVLGSVLAHKAAPRVADTLGYERALLLDRAHDDVGACTALREHASRFPTSDNAADVLSRLHACP